MDTSSSHVGSWHWNEDWPKDTNVWTMKEGDASGVKHQSASDMNMDLQGDVCDYLQMRYRLGEM